MEFETKSKIRIGIFAAVTLGTFGLVILLIGGERRLFERKASLHTAFPETSGLRVGAPVRLAGVDVGEVSRIEFAEAIGNKQVQVRFTVVRSTMNRVRRDSVARVGSKGLLGDKIIELTIGSETEPPVPEGGFVPGDSPPDVAEYLQRAGSILQEVERTVAAAAKAVQPLANARFGEDLQETMGNLRVITDHVARGPGAVHAALTDPAGGQHMRSLLANANRATVELAQASSALRMTLQEIQSGRGTVHELVYGRDGAEVVGNLRQTTAEVATLLRDIRTRPGTLHSLIYTDEQSDLVRNFALASAGIRDIVGDLRAGRGTLGALLVDPSVYEDLKTLLGDVGRNQALRALVRFAISESDAPPSPPAAGARPPPR